jgi:hypothetical protein
MRTVPLHRDEPKATPLQRRLLELAAVLADARGLEPRGREAFASIGVRMFCQSFPELAAVEAEAILAEAA